MKIKVFATFEFKDGTEKTLTWVEVDPKLIQRDQSTQEILSEVALTAAGLQKEYTKLISRMLQDNKVFSITDDNGVSHILPLSEVKSVRLQTEEVQEESQDTVEDSQHDNIVKAMGIKPKKHRIN